ncbi:SusC/RagA family TonB-linked outer membrane protein [Flavobacterium sp.]|uniref:SusC/RagA family TonB-linked outer membrane protein n=1 Tax=Flavobacterium sp. TaxID=239 RepID=UPI0026127303|nr:SusC/RagA family TonB-linked outer membrane protein [Flavobacterium sp.]
MRSKFKWIFTLLVALSMQFSFAQEKTVTGVVSDATGPLPGANVLVKSTGKGVQTDVDGKYAVKAKAGDVLVISFSGYETKNVTVGASNTVNVKLAENIQKIDEVVVGSFGRKLQTKKLAYSSQKVEAKELIQAAPVNAVTALQGKVSGLNIITRNNGVNPSTAIILRGYKSLTGDNSALIIIDGVVQANSALDNLNPNDITSVNTLKGSAATVLYGSQGKNGALVVTTKQGDNNKGLEVTYNTSYALERVKYFPELQTTFGPGFDDIYDPYENTSWGPRFDGVPRRLGPILADGSFQTVDYAAIKNNRRDFFVDGVTAINGLSFSGGDDKSTFFFSAQRSDITGITPNDEYTKDNFRFNATRKSGKFKIGLNTSFFSDKTDVVGDGGYQARPLYWSILNTPANVPLTSYKDWRNNPFATPEGYFNEYYQNPYMLIDIARNRGKSNRLFANLKFDYEFADWISASYSLTGTYFTSDSKNTRAAVTVNPVLAPTRTDQNTTASVAVGNSSNTRLNSDLLINIKKNLFKKLDANLTLGNAVTTFRSNAYSISGNNLFVPDLYNPGVRTGEPVVGFSEFQSTRAGYFADLSLEYNKFLTLSGAYRYDQSSTLLLDNNGFDFYSLGASLLLTEAIPGLKSDYIKYWKLFGSYASVGSDPTIGYTNELYATPTGFPFGSVVGLAAPTSAVDAGITPAYTKTLEFGTELALFKNRLNIGATYFINNSTDDFLNASTSYASGIASLRLNSGELETKGIELDVNGTVLQSDKFTWKVGVNVSKIESEVKSLSDGAERLQTGLAAGDGAVGIYAQVGSPFPSLFATAYTRDDNGNVVIDATTGDPVVSSELKNLGSTTPDLIVGFNTSVKYGQFTLSATADYKTGHVYYNNMVDALEFTGSTLHSVSSGRQPFIFPNSSYETSPGVFVPNTNITTSGGGFDFWNNTYNAIKENYVVDATTFKLREVALSYDLPSQYLKNTFIKNVSFGLVARNILMLRSAQNKYTDPEFTNDGQQVTGFGTQSQLPPTGSYGFKMDIKF